MKKIMRNIASVLTLSSLTITSAYAESIGDTALTLESRYSAKNDIVMVVYYTNKNPHSVMAKVKDLMHTRDPGGFMNPYWITNFYDTKVDTRSGCGLVIGEWYSNHYKERGSWESIMSRQLPYITDNAAYFYMRNGEWQPTTNQGSQLEAIESICK